MDVVQGNGKAQFMRISEVSMLGECETKFVRAVTGQLFPTKAMKHGTVMHEKLTEGLPKVTKEDIMGQMKSGGRMRVREIFVTDQKLRQRGRIDQLDLTGNVVDGKNEAIIIDDKFTRMNYDSIPPQYKLQLAAYSSAVHNSLDYGNICAIVGAKLVCRDRGSKEIIREFTVNRDEIRRWEYNVPLAAKVAWVLYRNERKPGHRKIDIVTGEWGRCSCWGMEQDDYSLAKNIQK